MICGKKTVIVPYAEIQGACIDDFATRKRFRYGTVMSDAATHRIVDMVNSRDEAEVARWLKQFPNLRYVVRDGSLTYRNAIEKAHPGCVQIADRFHLMKNVLDAAAAAVRKLPVRIKLGAFPDPSADTVNPAPARSRTEAEIRRAAKADQVRRMYDQGLSKRAISRETGLHRNTVTKYLEGGSPAESTQLGTRRSCPFGGWRKRIEELTARDPRMRGTEIRDRLRAEGYRGSDATVYRYWREARREFFGSAGTQDTRKVIPRKLLISALYCSWENVPELSEDDFLGVLEQYPELRAVFAYVCDFQDLLTSGDPRRLIAWVEDTKTHPCSGLRSAAHGIERDLEAACNAVALPQSNGVAEGNNTKIKLRMRVGYGRQSFEILRKTVLLQEEFRYCSIAAAP